MICRCSGQSGGIGAAMARESGRRRPSSRRPERGARRGGHVNAGDRHHHETDNGRSGGTRQDPEHQDVRRDNQEHAPDNRTFAQTGSCAPLRSRSASRCSKRACSSDKRCRIGLAGSCPDFALPATRSRSDTGELPSVDIGVRTKNASAATAMRSPASKTAAITATP
jgi:hypothetical protein